MSTNIYENPPRHTAKQVADDVAAGMDPDAESVPAQYYDQMKADRDEWKRLWTDHQRCAQCGDWGYGEICRVCVVIAERDELQRRLDAVVMEHIRTAELKCYCEFDRDHERTMECEYCEEVTALRTIAEGRTG